MSDLSRRRFSRKMGTFASAMMLLSVNLGAASEPRSDGPAAAQYVHPGVGIRLVAHRGGAAHAPENTLAAYRAAVERGDGAAECDVHLSKDGELVVIHDPTLMRTTDGYGTVARQTWRRLRQLDAGSWKEGRFAGERLPSLGEVMDVAKDELVLFVELKRGEGLVERVAREIDARPTQRHQFVIISFDEDMISKSARTMPDIPRMLLRHRVSGANGKEIRRAREVGATMLGVASRVARPGLVKAAHRSRMPLYSFTVNSSRRARELHAMGVDGIITDAPPKIARQLGG